MGKKKKTSRSPSTPPAKKSNARPPIDPKPSDPAEHENEPSDDEAPELEPPELEPDGPHRPSLEVLADTLFAYYDDQLDGRLRRKVLKALTSDRRELLVRFESAVKRARREARA